MVIYDDGATEPVRLFDQGVVYRDPETFGEYHLSYRSGTSFHRRSRRTSRLASSSRTSSAPFVRRAHGVPYCACAERGADRRGRGPVTSQRRTRGSSGSAELRDELCPRGSGWSIARPVGMSISSEYVRSCRLNSRLEGRRYMSVGVIGLGYVGLPLVVAFAEAGEEVVAVDVDSSKVAAIPLGTRMWRTSHRHGLSGCFLDSREHPLRVARPNRRGVRLCPDAAHPQSRAGPRTASLGVERACSCSNAVSLSCLSRPRIPARPVSFSFRSST